MKLSKIIKNYRNNLSLTMDSLSSSSSLSKGFISKIEKGDFDNKNVSLDSIIKLAKGLDVKVKEILDQLNVIEQDDQASLRVYLREKYKIEKEKDTKLIEDLINNLRED
ncbi:MAG: hypothetical protein COX30_03460 [Candidatus Moranbacteria bacterium CG23_combo_of_CG06-09_8_20_14_all_39_10]|nr:MAG: hypothetical protein COX30_03460 [Candidatus Moranbacteria bacterium CG23_combo_of_CG06-09_8_20_14_all_39_10]